MSFDREKILAALADVADDGARMSYIADALELPKREVPKLRRLVSSMVKEGDLVKPSRSTYRLSEELQDLASEPAAPPPRERGERRRRRSSSNSRAHAEMGADPFAVGRIRVHPAGYGFVEREDEQGDVFVPAKFRGSALDGDRVRVYTWSGYKGTEGRVDEVLSRGRAKLTGTVRRQGRSSYLEPDDPRISSTYGMVALEQPTHAADGRAVVVEITRYPTDREPTMEARVATVLGSPDDPRTEVAKILACSDIPVEFPDDALAQAAATPQALSDADLADRIDLRDKPFLTIDPVTARDFDDAICLESGPRGLHRVWIAVADVSHYVKRDDALDREAVIRGVSVYFPDRSIPMLPVELSSGICSLNPDVDRCAMVVRLDIDSDGRVVDRMYAAAVIRSHARLDYPGVAAALQGDFRGRRASYRKWEAALREMDELAQTMRRRRMSRGSLNLEMAEPRVVLDDDDPMLVRDVVEAKGQQDVRRAYQLVEEYMLAANEAVGRFFDEREVPAIWRIHAPPSEEKVYELSETLHNFGVSIDVARAMEPLGMQRALEQLEGTPHQRALTFLVLRSLSRAEYSVENVGHFGLASRQYIHFTSPIRRYPDLVVHRLMKFYLHKEGQAAGGGGRWKPPSEADLAEAASACSTYERRATDAEREVVDMYRAFVMRDRVGDTFEGVIATITNFGMFVQLEEPFVEGLIKLDSLGDEYYEFDQRKMRLHGRKTGITFALGQPVRVEVAAVSVPRRQIDLRLLSMPFAHRSARDGEDGESSGPRPSRTARGRAERRDQTRKARTRREGRPERKSRSASKDSGRGSKGPKGSKGSKGSKSRKSKRRR